MDSMAAYPLSEVLTSILTALSTAQRSSDAYSQSLYKSGLQQQPELNILPVPWAQLSTVDLALKFAIASVTPPSGSDPTTPPVVEVYVTAEDLSGIDPKDISTLDLQINVTDQEYVAADGSGGDGG